MLAEYPKTRKPLRSHKARSVSPHPITSPSLLPVEVEADSEVDIKWDTGNEKILETNPVQYVFNDSTVKIPCNYIANDQDKPTPHLVSFDECFDYGAKSFKDYQIELSVDIGNGNLPEGLISYSWIKLGGPASGVITQADTSDAIFSNAQKAGNYNINLKTSIEGEDSYTNVQVVLPFGGPNMTQYMNDEFTRYRQWANGWRFYVDSGPALSRFIREAELVVAYTKTLNAMKHGTLKPTKGNSPCKRINFGLTTATVEDYVFKTTWMGNVLFGYVMAIYDPTGLGAENVGAITEFFDGLDNQFVDGDDDKEAYAVGRLKAGGANLKNAIEARDIKLMQNYPANVLWPSKTDIYAPPTNFPTY